jgi:hypothetical protein
LNAGRQPARGRRRESAASAAAPIAFQWNRHVKSGIAIVDCEHRGLIGLINEAAPLCWRAADRYGTRRAPLRSIAGTTDVRSAPWRAQKKPAQGRFLVFL